MSNIIGAGLIIAAIACGLLLTHQLSAATHARHAESAQASAVSISPLDLMRQPGRHLPPESWPAF